MIDYSFTTDFKEGKNRFSNETTDLATDFYPARKPHRLAIHLGCFQIHSLPRCLMKMRTRGAKKREERKADEERSEKLFPCKVPRGLARGYEILMAHKM